MDQHNLRNISFDFIRILACLMIVVMHSPLSNEAANGMFLSGLSYLTAPGIGLFFMISGALLLPVRQDMKAFFQRRFTKIVFPALFWSLFYLCANIVVLHQPVEWGRAILSLPFSAQGTPVFWFIYTLLGLYLLAPILSRWLQAASRREVEFYLGLWAVSLCYPFLKYVANVNTSSTGILYYFSGFAGYFVLGYYLKTYPERISWKILIPAVAVSFAVPIVCKLRSIEVDFYDLFWYLSVFVAIQCVGWWKLIDGIKPQAIGEKAGRFIAGLSKLTFGIYLVHIFIMRYVLWRCSFVLSIENYYIQTLVVVVLTFLLSALCSYLISWLPKAQYLIGYGRRRTEEHKFTEET